MKGLSIKKEKELFKQGYACVAGIDEVGRGAWAGPLVGAAVILDIKNQHKIAKVQDSKKLTFKQRLKLAEDIKKYALSWVIIEIQPEEIDRFGVDRANACLVERCCQEIEILPDYLLIDKMTVAACDLNIAREIIIKGDSKVKSIACASIIAKVHRDLIMTEYHKKYPNYGFDEHKGYGTEKHSQMLAKHGRCPIHRMSYKPINQPKLI